MEQVYLKHVNRLEPEKKGYKNTQQSFRYLPRCVSQFTLMYRYIHVNAQDDSCQSERPVKMNIYNQPFVSRRRLENLPKIIYICSKSKSSEFLE